MDIEKAVGGAVGGKQKKAKAKQAALPADEGLGEPRQEGVWSLESGVSVCFSYSFQPCA